MFLTAITKSLQLGICGAELLPRRGSGPFMFFILSPKEKKEFVKVSFELRYSLNSEFRATLPPPP
jgi:hypothetical protein